MKTNFLQVHCQANLFSFLESPLRWDSRLLVIPHVSLRMGVLLGSSIARPTGHLLDEGGYESKRIRALHSSGSCCILFLREVRLLSLLSYLLLHPLLFSVSLVKTTIFRDPATPSTSLFSRIAYIATRASGCSRSYADVGC